MKLYCIVFICIVTMLSAVSVCAQFGTGYIGLYADGDHDLWCAEGEPTYTVEMWVWCLPSYNGTMCSEFGVSYPDNVIKSTITINVALWSAMPNVHCESNICYCSACYVMCQTYWHWVYRHTLFVTDSSPSYCEIVPHPPRRRIPLSKL